MNLFPWRKHRESTGGAQAREAAEEHLRETRDQWPEVRRVAASLRDLREHNHFAEQLIHIFGGQRKTR